MMKIESSDEEEDVKAFSLHKDLKKETLNDSDEENERNVGNTGRKARRRIVVDSSSSDDEDKNNSSITKRKRNEKLKQLALKRRKKSGAAAPEHVDSGTSDDSDDNFVVKSDDDDLPMFEHEDFPPDEVKAEMKEEEESDDDFIVADDIDEVKDKSEEEGSEEEGSEEESETGSEVGSDVSSDDVPVNPYLQRDEEADGTNILDVLSKSTSKDKKNKRRYTREQGRYQFEIHSEYNRALATSNEQRFRRNMGRAKFDAGLKQERNLERLDAEYYESSECALLGQKARVFPHTKMTSRYSSRCALDGCHEQFSTGETKIVGVELLCPLLGRFAKKQGRFGKESYYMICYKHCTFLEGFSDSEEYNSDSEDESENDTK